MLKNAKMQQTPDMTREAMEYNDFSHVRKVEPGVVFIGHTNGLSMLDPKSVRNPYPDDLEVPPVGVVDDYQQVTVTARLPTRKRKFMVFLTPFYRDYAASVRWDQLPVYVGERERHGETLGDEPEIMRVLQYHVVELR